MPVSDSSEKLATSNHAIDFKNAVDQHRVLVSRPVFIGGYPGGKDQFIPVKNTQYNVCVSNVYCQYHILFLHLLPLSSDTGDAAQSQVNHIACSRPCQTKLFTALIHIAATEWPRNCDIIRIKVLKNKLTGV